MVMSETQNPAEAARHVQSLDLTYLSPSYLPCAPEVVGFSLIGFLS